MGQPMRKRQSHAKAKTGCKTCKARKVKCDEIKPRCLRCLKAGINFCEYPENNGKPLKSAPVVTSRLMPLAPKPGRSGPRSLESSIPLSLMGTGRSFHDECDYQYYSHFITAFLHMKPSVSYLGAFESDLWSRLLPQAAVEEEFARHAVIALGAVNKAAEASQVLTPDRDLGIREQSSLQQSRRISNKHHEASVQHYGKAIALIQGQFSNPTLDARRIQNALVACTLFCSLEHAYGGLEAALRPLQAGVNLLLDFQEDRRKHSLASATTGSSIIDSDLLDIFLHFESVIYRVKGKPDCRDALYQLGDDAAALEILPTKFSSLRQSRTYLDLIHRQFQESVIKWQKRQEREATLPVNDEENSGFKDGRSLGNVELFQNLASRWQKAFSPLLRRCRADFRNKPHLMAATYLELRWLLLDLDIKHLDCLAARCSHEVALNSCKSVAKLATQLLESDEVIVLHGPTIPRYNMLLEEVVSLISRIADRHDSGSIAQVAKEIEHKYGTTGMSNSGSRTVLQPHDD